MQGRGAISTLNTLTANTNERFASPRDKTEETRRARTKQNQQQVHAHKPSTCKKTWQKRQLVRMLSQLTKAETYMFYERKYSCQTDGSQEPTS